MTPGRIALAIVGVQKAGTTSLLRYVSQHPELSGHVPVEFGYFVDDEEWGKGWEAARARYFYRATTNRLVAKSGSLYMSSEHLRRLRSHNPDCTVAIILRDPVERAFSAYRMEVNEGWIDHPFDYVLTALDDDTHLWNRLFIQFGDYPAALRRVYDVFPASQVQVIIYESFIAAPVKVCQEAFERLGIDSSFSPDTRVAYNIHSAFSSRVAGSALGWLRAQRNPLKQLAKRALPPRAFDRIGQALLEANRTSRANDDALSPEVRAALESLYRGKNRELQRLLGVDLSHWSGMNDPVSGCGPTAGTIL